MQAASSSDALGTIPGSLNAVRSNDDITKINNQAATTGTAGDTSENKYGQLQTKTGQNHTGIKHVLQAYTVDILTLGINLI